MHIGNNNSESMSYKLKPDISGMDKDKDKDKDVFIGLKEFVSHMMMTQTKYRLYHQLK